MTYFDAALLGAVQGVCEFLPVSSSGHLALAQQLLDLDADENLAFALRLHAATLGAVIAAFWGDLTRLAGSLFRLKPEARLVGMLFLAMIPTGAAALLLKPHLESAMDSSAAVGAGLFATGCILFLSKRFARLSEEKADEIEKTNALRALWIGLAQGVAVLPGVSRSGATIGTGLLLGLKGEASARFSFLLSILAISAAMSFDILEGFENSSAPLGPSLVGAAAAFLTGLASIRWLMRLARLRRFDGFAYYCWAVGAAALAAAAL